MRSLAAPRAAQNRPLWNISRPTDIWSRLSRMDRQMIGLFGLWGTPLLTGLALSFVLSYGTLTAGEAHGAGWPVWWSFVIGGVLLLVILPAIVMGILLLTRRILLARLMGRPELLKHGLKGLRLDRAPGQAATSLALPPPPFTRKLALLSALMQKYGHAPAVLAMYRAGGGALCSAGPVIASLVMPPLVTRMLPLTWLRRLAGGAMAGLIVASPFLILIGKEGFHDYVDREAEIWASIAYVTMLFTVTALLQAMLAKAMQALVHLWFDPASRSGVMLVGRDGVSLLRHGGSEVIAWSALRKPERPRAAALLRPRWGRVIRTGLAHQDAVHLGQIASRRALFPHQAAFRKAG